MFEDIKGPLSIVGNPPLGFRFGVFFFPIGVLPYASDIMFQKVSGLESEVKTDTVEEGGQNLHSHVLPTKIANGTLKLERGLFVGSPLSIEFNTTMSLFKFKPSTVLVTLLDNTRIPMAAWLFLKAFPVKWSVSDFDAQDNAVVIETMELAYRRMQVIRV